MLTWWTSLRSAVISASRALVARHGEQNAEENWSKVTRDPKSDPISEALTVGVAVAAGDLDLIRPRDF
jgi:hypothetical protein